MKVRNKKLVYTIIGIISLLLVVVAITYAYWLVTKTQTKENVISTGCLDITLTDDSAAIELLKVEPITDTEGKTLTPYTFTVTNNCNTVVDYQIALETFESTTTMQASSIKVMIDEEEPVLLSTKGTLSTTIKNATKSYLLKTRTLTASGTEKSSESHTLRVWIDYDSPNSDMGKTFESQISVTIGQGITNPTLCKAATADTVTSGNIPAGNYENGDEYICEVEEGVKYNFFVIGKEDNGEVNLIADRNMTLDESGNTVPATTDNTGAPAWVSVEDYNANPKVDAPCEADATHTCYSTGPITALNRLDAVVANWTNLPLKNYETQEYTIVVSNTELGQQPGEWRYITDAGWPIYNKITRNTRARMLTVQEAVDNGCMFEYDETVDGLTTKHFLGTCPLYMSNYVQFKDSAATYENPDAEIAAKFAGYQAVSGVRGYWLSTANPGYSTNGHCGIGIHDNAVLNCTYTSIENYYGIRPVITLSLDNFDI